MTSLTEVKIDRLVRGFSVTDVKRVVAAALKMERAGRKVVSVWVTDNATIRKVNRKFLGHDWATDVISFGLGDGPAPKSEAGHLGDLIVSAQMARQASRELKIPYQEELARYLIHGTLHLLGYNDQSSNEQKKMHRRQEEILEKI